VEVLQRIEIREPIGSTHEDQPVISSRFRPVALHVYPVREHHGPGIRHQAPQVGLVLVGYGDVEVNPGTPPTLCFLKKASLVVDIRSPDRGGFSCGTTSEEIRFHVMVDADGRDPLQQGKVVQEVEAIDMDEVCSSTANQALDPGPISARLIEVSNPGRSSEHAPEVVPYGASEAGFRRDRKELDSSMLPEPGGPFLHPTDAA
jgi:hypothetical protein